MNSNNTFLLAVSKAILEEVEGKKERFDPDSYLPDHFIEALKGAIGLEENRINSISEPILSVIEELKEDAERIDFLSSMIRSENIDLGIAIYAGSKIIDTVCKEFVWVSNFSDTNSDIECFDDIGEGKTLREAIDAAIAAQKVKP